MPPIFAYLYWQWQIINTQNKSIAAHTRAQPSKRTAIGANLHPMPIAVLIIAGVLLYSFANQGKAAVQNFQYTPVKVTKWHFGIFSSGFDFVFKITNNTNTSASIDGIDGQLFNGTTFIGTFKTNQAFTIPAAGSVDVPATLQASNVEAVKILFNTLVQRRTPAIDFKGGILTRLFGRVPFNYPALLATDLKFKKR